MTDISVLQRDQTITDLPDSWVLSCSFDLEYRLDLDRIIEWQRCNADGKARMATDLFPEDFYDKFRCTVENKWRFVEVRRGMHKAADLNTLHDSIQVSITCFL